MALVGAKRGMVAALVAIAWVSAAWAEKTHEKTTFWLKPNLTAPIDWTSKSSYQKAENNPSEFSFAPEAGDIIVLKKDIKASVTGGTPSAELIRTMARITFYDGAELEIVADSDIEWESSLYKSSSATLETAKVVKRGAGNLILKSINDTQVWNGTSEWHDYEIGWDIYGGTVTLVNCKEKSRNRWLRSVYVAEGATLDVGTGDASGGVAVFFGTLTGSGTVTKANDGKVTMLEFRGNSVQGFHAQFDGTITGPLAIRLYGYSLDLTGIHNDFNGGQTVFDDANGIHSSLGFTLLGFESEGDTSIGYKSFSMTKAGTLKYIGYPDARATSGSKSSYFIGPGMTLDGGAYGGLEMRTTLGLQSSWKNNTYITLIGSNQTECVFNGAIAGELDGSGNRVSERIIKNGTGIWRMAANNNRRNGGVIEVNEGTLRFDSLAEKGSVCSLGYADALFESYVGAYDESKKVDYAFELGSTEPTEAIATLEYTGASDVKVTTRPFALKGEGCLKTADGAGKLDLTGFGLLAGQTSATLHLGADGFGKVSKASDFDAGSGTINIVKEGIGTWSMAGKLAGIGGITVKEGTLNYANHAQYEFYRFVIKECINEQYHVTNNVVQLSEVALFDKDGNRQNLYLTYVPGFDIDNLNCGECLMTDYGMTKGLSYDRNPNGMFDDDRTTQLPRPNGGLSDNSVQIYAPSGKYNAGNSATWACVVMRLDTHKTNPVAGIDMLASWSGNGNYFLSAWALEGSTDGHSWTEICNSTSVGFDASKAVNGRWYKQNTSFNNGDTAVGKVKTDNFEVAAYSGPTVTSTGLALRVDSAGALNLSAPITVDKLEVDVGQGFGTAAGVELAATGELALVEVADRFAEIEVFGINVLENPAFANIANWSVSINGRPTARAVEVDEDGYVTVRPIGTVLFLR